jgi:hypothetical protein
MPLSKSTLQKMNDCIDMLDSWLQQRQQDRLDGIDDDEDEDTDPVQFQYPREKPVAEPPTMPQDDSALKKRDLFR